MEFEAKAEQREGEKKQLYLLARAPLVRLHFSVRLLRKKHSFAVQLEPSEVPLKMECPSLQTWPLALPRSPETHCNEEGLFKKACFP